MQRRKFSREFKVEAVRLIKERGVSVAQAGRDLDVHENVLRKWMRELAADPAHAFPGHGQVKPEQLEIDRLRREVAKLKAERDILKKAAAFFARKRHEVRLHREAPGHLAGGVAVRSAGCLPLGLPCLAQSGPEQAGTGGRGDRRRGAGELPRQRSHLWCQAGVEGRARRGRRLRPASDRATDAGPGAAGSAAPTLPATGRGPRAKGAVAPNVLDRQFAAEQANSKWIADFTYIWTAEGWLYVAAVIDLFSRRVVGWSMKAEMTAELVADALVMAIWRRGKPDALLHHSDQGSQYTSDAFQRLMADLGITCSMSRSGNVWDNAAMESFFSSLKTERIGKTVYRTRDDARADVFDYIERFYNTVRRHSTLGYRSPVEYERQALLA